MTLKQLYKLYDTLPEFSLATTIMEHVVYIKDPNQVLIVSHLAKTKPTPTRLLPFSNPGIMCSLSVSGVFD
jgi:hypothetical protein